MLDADLTPEEIAELARAACDAYWRSVLPGPCRWQEVAQALLRRHREMAREEAGTGDHRPSRSTAYHADDPRLKSEPPVLRITVDINGVAATSTLRPRSDGKATAEDLEKAVVAVARMAAQMIARERVEREGRGCLTLT